MNMVLIYHYQAEAVRRGFQTLLLETQLLSPERDAAS